MATGRLGFPAINDPRTTDLRGLQQVVSNIRQRFQSLDAIIATLQTSAIVAADTATDTAALRKMLVNLQAELDALEAVVAGLTGASSGGDTDPRTEQLTAEVMDLRNAVENPPADPRVEQLAGELLTLQSDVDGLGDGQGDAERVPAIEAHLTQLQQQVDAIDTVGQTAVHSALLQKLQEQVDSYNLGVLV